MKAHETAKSFPTYRILAFEVWYLGSNLSNFESENSIGWGRFAVVSALTLLVDEKAFDLAHFTMQNIQQQKKRAKSTRQTHFFKMSQTSFI